MNCESDGQPLCENGWQTRWEVDKLERVPCVLCRKDAWAGWAKNWKIPPRQKKAD